VSENINVEFPNAHLTHIIPFSVTVH